MRHALRVLVDCQHILKLAAWSSIDSWFKVAGNVLILLDKIRKICKIPPNLVKLITIEVCVSEMAHVLHDTYLRLSVAIIFCPRPL